MSRMYNGFMSKVVKYFWRYSLGKNSSVRELPEQDDPLLRILASEKVVDSSSLKSVIEKAKNKASGTEVTP